MKQTGKTILTIFVVLICCFVCFLSFGYYLSKTKYLSYDSARLVDLVIKDVSAEELGKEYEGRSEEGKTYYMLEITIDNPSNCGRDGYSFYLTYDTYAYENYSIVDTIEDDISYRSWENGYYLPPGKESTVYEIICVDDACKKLDVIYRNYEIKKEQRVAVDL